MARCRFNINMSFHQCHYEYKTTVAVLSLERNPYILKDNGFYIEIRPFARCTGNGVMPTYLTHDVTKTLLIRRNDVVIGTNSTIRFKHLLFTFCRELRSNQRKEKQQEASDLSQISYALADSMCVLFLVGHL